MNNKALRLSLAAVIAAAGMYLLIVLLNSMRPVIVSGVFLIPGQFLYLCFMEAAFYLPLLFLISSFLLIADYYNSKIFTIKILSLLPFFTYSLLLRVLNYTPGSPAADFIIRNLGIRGGSMVLGLLLIPEMLLIIRILLGRHTTAKSSTAVSERSKAAFVVDNVDEMEVIDEVEEVEEVEETEEAEEADEDETSNAPEHMYEPVPLQWDEDAVEVIQDVVDFDETEPEIDIAALEFYDEQIVEPLDLDPDAGRITEFTEDSMGPVFNDDNFPDAPVRGDEEEISQAARDVWADAEQLGFDDVMTENIVIEPVDSEIVEDDDDLNFDLESAAVSLEIPDVPDITEEPSPESIAEVLDELNSMEDESDAEFLEELDEFEDGEDEDAVDIDLVLTPAFEKNSDDDNLTEEITETLAEMPDVPALKPKKHKRRGKYRVPVDELLEHYEDDSYWIVDDETRKAAEVLRQTLEEFKIAAEVTGISKGPVITMFEILPAPGVKLSKIVNLADNIALRLAASRVRIVAPIPGKHAVGIEVPNKSRAIVSFKEILESEDLRKSKMMIPVVLGKDITGGARVIDLVQTPHLLIAGATGSGKSVCVNSLICSILYSRTPDEVKLILIDPKIVELKMYNDIPHLLTPVITEPKKAFQALQYAMCEMERRYTLLNALGVRDIKAYNRRVKDLKLATDLLPYIVIIVDEFADLMATTGKELENVISRLAAMSRAIGIHLVLATQRPSVDVITGLIKANIPSRIAFMVASKTDSRIILDTMGADKLLGKGDMLFTSAWNPNLSRIQGAFLSDDEVERVTDHVKTLGEPDYIDDEIFVDEDENGEFELESSSASDPLMETAVSIVVEAGKASASYLQRRLKIGYNRAARLVEDMEERGIVGPSNGSKPREIIHIPDRF